MASWCLQNPGCRRAYGQRALEVADLADQMDLQQEFTDVSTMLGPYIAADNRSPHGNATVNSQRQSTYRNLASYPRQVRDQICEDMPELDGCP